MLFKTRFHPGIKDGTVCLTYRAWQTARVSTGRSYRLGAAGAIEVDAVESVPLSAIRDVDARHAGFAHKVELIEALKGSTTRRLTSRSRVFRVSFHYVAKEDSRIALRSDVSPDALAEVQRRLQRMDRASNHGPWNQRVLELIVKRPKTRAPDLAAGMDRATELLITPTSEGGAR